MRRYLPYILYAVIVIGLVAAIIFAFNADDPASKTDKKNPSTSSEQKKSDSGNKTGSQNSGSGSAGSVAQRPNPTYTPPSTSGSSSSSSSASSSGTAQQTQGQSASTAGGAGSTQQLANTGPGETLTAFALVSLIGAVAFSLYQRRAFVS